MNCVELQKSLAEIEDGGSAEQQAHLKSCPECSALVAELNLVASTAVELRAAHEPSPRVWNSIEIALRQEGLIRPPRAGGSLIPSFGSRWGWTRWAVPVAAAVLITVGVYLHQRFLPMQVAQDMRRPVVSAVVPGLEMAGLNDNDLLEEISQQAPELRAQYEDYLRRANQYIQDAASDVAANPNDAEARRSLLTAYQQKAMLFELALDRSLP
jgi:hypothetical protein